MLKYLLIPWMILCTVTASGQRNKFNIPDYKKINKIISKTDSPASYIKLMDRYRIHDTTLTTEEYHLLYFGYCLQPQYAPYAHQQFADSLMTIVRKKQIGPDQYENVIKYANKVFESNPFDMRYLDPLIYVYQMQGKIELAQKLEFKLGRLIETIFNTGDGLTEKTAFHVISVSHEYDLLRALGFGYAGEQSLTRGECDFLKVETNDYGINGIYFNVSAIMKPMK